ncbi:MAG TPA: DUF4352 domain-containing protein [Thermomicrobiales bacterium]|nr:DUF4352 domain-containing protein [Thermomicrobiales bacterium]
MRKLLVALFAMLFMVGGSTGFAAAQGTPATPVAGQGGAGNPANPQIGDTVTYFGTNGTSIGSLKVTKITRGWDSYQQYEDPKAGDEYVAVYLTVTNTASRGTLEIQAYNFALQDTQGFEISTAYAQGRDSLKTKPLTDTLEIPAGKSVNTLLVFEVYQDQPLQALYWMPDGYLINLADLSKS